MDDYIVLLPNKKSQMELITSVLNEPGTKKSLQASRFTTIKSLCKEVTRELSLDKRVLDEVTCKEILKELVSKNDSTLRFGSLKGFAGLYDNLYSLIIKFKENRFKGAVERSTLSNKTVSGSFLSIYNEYNECLRSNSYFDEADEVTFAMDNLSKSNILSNVKNLFIVGFVHFSRFEEPFIHRLSESFSATNLYMLYSEDEKQKRLYANLSDIFLRISSKDTCDIIHVKDAEKSPANNLEYVKNNIFTTYKSKAESDFADDSVELVNSETVHNEVKFVAAKIRSLLDLGSYTLDDISVILRQTGEYSKEIVSTFKKYKIPINFDNSNNISQFSIIKTVMLPLYIVSRDFVRDDLIGFLGSDYIDLKSDIDMKMVEACLMKAGVIKGLKSYAPKLSHYEQVSADLCVKRSRKFIEKATDHIIRVIKKRDTVSGYKSALTSLLEDDYKLKERIVTDHERLDPTFVKRDILCYLEFKSAFDEIERAFRCSSKGDREISVSELIILLNERLKHKSISLDERADYGISCDSIDCAIRFFTPEEFFLKPYKVVFVMNLTDGTYPKKVSNSFLLEGQEGKYGFLIKDAEILHNERLFFYRALSLCDEKLIITYQNSAGEGAKNGFNGAGRSSFVDDVAILIGDESSLLKSDLSAIKECQAGSLLREDILRDFFYHLFDEPTIRAREEFDYIMSSTADAARLKRIFKNVIIERERGGDGTRTRYEGNILSGDDTFKSEIEGKIEGRTFSASQIDKFANCPLDYFFSKLLYLSAIEVPKIEVKSREKGTILHAILCDYYSSKSASNIIRISTAVSKEMSDDELEEEILEESSEIETLSHQYFNDNVSELKALAHPYLIEIEKANIVNILKSVVRYEIVEKNKARLKLKKAHEKYQAALNKAKGKPLKYVSEAKERLEKAKNSPFFYEPFYFEHAFGFKQNSCNRSLPEGVTNHGYEVRIDISEAKNMSESILLRGVIDRIDVNSEEHKFIVIDYKSGGCPREIEVKNGLNFQLPLYAEYVKSELKKGYDSSHSEYYVLIDPKTKRKRIKISLDEIRGKLRDSIRRARNRARRPGWCMRMGLMVLSSG
ncbi:PD-(D/E)XK nuclease family protein [Thermodesulfobacteriota bacterium]